MTLPVQIARPVDFWWELGERKTYRLRVLWLIVPVWRRRA